MNSIRYIMLTVSLITATTASLGAMKKKAFISDHTITMDEEYKDFSECVKSKKPMSLVQYVAKYNVSHQELSDVLNEEVLKLSDIKEFMSQKTVLHCAVEGGKYPKAIPTLLMAEDKQE